MSALTTRRDEKNSAVCIATLNRPERANAYTREMLEALEALLGDRSLRALVITGAGERAFCAGADLDELDAQRFGDGYGLKSRDVFNALAAAPFLCVAALNGAARGGGLELALACDIRVCAPRASFGLPEVQHGLLPAAGGLRRLGALIGGARARQLALSAEPIDAETAENWGLVTHRGASFMERALELARVAAGRDPHAIRLAKSLFRNPDVELEAQAQGFLYERRARRGES